MLPADFQTSSETLLWQVERVPESPFQCAGKPQVFQQKAGEWKATAKVGAPEPDTPSSQCCANGSFSDTFASPFF